jgi:prepilin-type N-terminal cleavage/methylation domain-containing protein
MAPLFTDDDGFTIVEVMISLVILGIVILMTVGPTSTGFRLLTNADVTTVETNLAQGRVEEIRSLEYKDVGFTSSLPAGALEPSETVTVKGIDYQVETAISYFGSANGGDVIPQGGDGVQGHFDTGIDFKQVTVTVTRADGSFQPVEMNTIIAPPSLAANDNLANVIFDLVKVEPDGKDPSILPYPKAFLVYDDDSHSYAYPGTPDDDQVFVGVPVNASSAPGYYYYGRLGTQLDSIDSGTGWTIYPDDLTGEADRVHLSPTQTETMTLRIYLPAELHVELVDGSDGSPVEGPATLHVSSPQGDMDYSDASSEWNGSGWDITDIDGTPLVPGEYSFSLHAFGYARVDRPAVVVPDGYPDVLSHTETFSLESVPTSTLTVHVVDAVGVPLRDATVSVTDLEGTYTYTTDAAGDVAALVEGVNPLVTVSATSHHGHLPATQSVAMLGDTSVTTVLGTPAGYGLITFTDTNLGVDHYTYLPRHGSPDDVIVVSPNVDGEGSAAVDAATWMLSKVCASGSSLGADRQRVNSGDHLVWSTSGSLTCPAP